MKSANRRQIEKKTIAIVLETFTASLPVEAFQSNQIIMFDPL